MGGLELLAIARRVGLDVKAEGTRLVIRGPKKYDALARQLIECKGLLLPLLRGAAVPEPSGDAELLDLAALEPCPHCGSLELWQSVGGKWHCSKCSPSKLLPQVAKPQSDRPEPEAESSQRCRCGSDRFSDVAIHGGQSTRRDCAQCGRFLDFVRWYGNATNTQN